MKALDIALKDLVRHFRSAFALVMMFVLPIMITGLLYFAFGNVSSGVSVPATRLVIANLDAPPAQSTFSGGAVLAEHLQEETLAGLLQVSLVADEATARAAVDDRAADAALIIPSGFTAAALSHDGAPKVTIYHDPVKTFAPQIVNTIVSQMLDSFLGARIAAEVASAQLAAGGAAADEATLQAVAEGYVQWTEAASGDGSAALLRERPPASSAQVVSPGGGIIGPVMAGMMIFFVFFTGAVSAQSIVREDEEGTLSRLFTTPTPRWLVLAGKLLAVFMILVVQTAVLLLGSALIFGISWGQPLAVALSALGMTVGAAGFGVFVMSLVKNMRQAGPVMGAVFSVTGMLGGLFTVGVQNLPASFATLNLLTPHGWALRAFRLSLAGDGAGQLILPLVVLLVIGFACFAVGALFFRKRFA